MAERAWLRRSTPASSWPPFLPNASAQGDRDRALAVLNDAAGEAQRLGMVPFSTRITQLRKKLNATQAAASPLSLREQEVARLGARGLTSARRANCSSAEVVVHEPDRDRAFADR